MALFDAPIRGACLPSEISSRPWTSVFATAVLAVGAYLCGPQLHSLMPAMMGEIVQAGVWHGIPWINIINFYPFYMSIIYVNNSFN